MSNPTNNAVVEVAKVAIIAGTVCLAAKILAGGMRDMGREVGQGIGKGIGKGLADHGAHMERGTVGAARIIAEGWQQGLASHMSAEGAGKDIMAEGLASLSKKRPLFAFTHEPGPTSSRTAVAP